MPSEKLPFRQRLSRAFRAANAAMTPASVVRITIERIVVIGAAFLSMKITGLWPLVDAFLTANKMRILETLAVNFMIYQFLSILGMYLFAFLKGLFDLREETVRTSEEPQQSRGLTNI